MSTQAEIYDDISSEGAFVEFARRFGQLVPLDNGSFVKKLRVSTSENARKNSLSEIFGTGAFPFHTDTAFWTRPARLVLLRAVGGNLHRPTLLRPFASVLDEVGLRRVRQSSWICSTGRRKNYTTMYFEHDQLGGMRYDPNCMTPANNAAREVDKILRVQSFNIKGGTIDWVPNRVAVIPNWDFLHARDISEIDDSSRLIERIYIY